MASRVAAGIENEANKSNPLPTFIMCHRLAASAFVAEKSKSCFNRYCKAVVCPADQVAYKRGMKGVSLYLMP